MLVTQGEQNSAIMKPEEQDFPVQKEDQDSGLDNSSDSGHSCDEEPSQISTASSDTEDFIKSEENIHMLEPAEFHHQIEIITCPHWKEECKLDSVKIDSDEHVLLASDIKEAAVLEVDSLTEHNNNNGVDSIAFMDDYPEYYKNLSLKGTNEPVDYSITINDKPEWLDIEKFKRGQKFALDNSFGINFAESSALFLIFSLKYALAPLIFTGNSDTPFKCFKRYLSTALRVKSWYKTDVWSNESNNGRTNLNIVRGMHKNLHSNITSTTQDEFEKKATIWSKAEWSSKFPLRDVAEEDFKGTCPMTLHHQHFDNHKPKVVVSQSAMALTQFSFVGLVVTYPKHYGMHYATDEDLEAFIHVWRGLGYLLGIKDEFNFCNADLATVRQRTHDLIDLMIKPSLRNVTADWEHMARCLIDGVSFYIKGFCFEPALLFICDVINLHTPRLKKYVGFKYYFMYLTLKFVYGYLCKIPSIFNWLNYRVNKNIELAAEVSPETLSKWEAKEFSYVSKNKNT